MDKICKRDMMEGFIVRELGLLHDGAYNVNQNYIAMGFDLYDSGGHGGLINEPWEAQEECLKDCVGFGCHSFGFHCVGLMLLVRVVLLKLRNEQTSTLS